MKRQVSTNENIIPACFAETILLETIGYSCKKNHQLGDGNVIRTLKNIKGKKVIALADKPEGIAPAHFTSDYKDIRTGSHNLILKKSKTKEHYIIYINEVLEPWLFAIAKSTKVKGYGSVDLLKAELKSHKSLNNTKLLKYFKEINTKKASPFRTIDNWIKEINQ